MSSIMLTKTIFTVTDFLSWYGTVYYTPYMIRGFDLVGITALIEETVGVSIRLNPSTRHLSSGSTM